MSYVEDAADEDLLQFSDGKNEYLREVKEHRLQISNSKLQLQRNNTDAHWGLILFP